MNCFKRRLSYGWTPEEACKPIQRISYRGRIFASRHALARAYGFHHSSLNSQLNRGKTIKEAMDYLLNRECRLLARRLQDQGLISADEPI